MNSQYSGQITINFNSEFIYNIFRRWHCPKSGARKLHLHTRELLQFIQRSEPLCHSNGEKMSSGFDSSATLWRVTDQKSPKLYLWITTKSYPLFAPCGKTSHAFFLFNVNYPILWKIIWKFESCNFTDGYEEDLRHRQAGPWHVRAEFECQKRRQCGNRRTQAELHFTAETHIGKSSWSAEHTGNLNLSVFQRSLQGGQRFSF